MRFHSLPVMVMWHDFALKVLATKMQLLFASTNTSQSADIISNNKYISFNYSANCI